MTTYRYRNSLMEQALDGTPMKRPPVWLMRQAGRTDPEYNALKEQCGMTLEEMFSNAEISAQVSLLPRKLGIDAIIFFQDILTISTPMGCEFLFRPGPQLENPIRSTQDIDQLKDFDVADKLAFVPETLRQVQQQLDGEMPVLGFAGAPLTLAVFLIEGRSFGQGTDQFFKFLTEQPEAMHRLLDKICNKTIDYLLIQKEAGVLAVQLFESAAYLLSEQQYATFALPYQQKIFSALKGKIPTICFAHNWTNIKQMGDSGADIVSLPSTVTIPEARAVLGENAIVQGNVSNKVLEQGSKEEISTAVKACFDGGGCHHHIFNLDHGLIRTTPFENVQWVVEAVKALAS